MMSIPVAGSMWSGCIQERFSSSSAGVSVGKKSSGRTNGSSCSITRWMVMSPSVICVVIRTPEGLRIIRTMLAADPPPVIPDGPRIKSGGAVGEQSLRVGTS